MKKVLSLLFCVLFLLPACNPDNPEQSGNEKVEWSVNPAELSFANDDSATKFVSLTADGTWSVTSSDAWIHVSPASGKGKGSLSVSVDPFTSGTLRKGSITVNGSTTLTIAVSQGTEGLTPVAVSFDGNKRGTTTYQLLVYSFADSDGDGVGDFKGIEQKLDYLDGLGVTALWLSPIHPADSYHGYDVQDYFAVNPQFGTEADFRSLLDKAHAKGIKIYIDYVLNHSGKGHPWFLEAMSDPSSPYRDYYFISKNPQKDYASFPMLKGSSYNAGDWVARTGGSPKLKITKTTEPVTNSDAEGWNLFNWGGTELKGVSFLSKGDGSYYMVKDINGTYGFLIRKMKNWDAGSKFGAKAGEGTLVEGKEMSLVGDGADISFTGNGRYKIELTNVNSIETVYFMCAFGEWMPDLNYGDPATAENNACFKDLAASADKWIQMGIDGFRLDAVKHICGGIWSYSNSGNQTFLKKWYDHCNATYHAAGHTDDIFMVGEVWSGHNEEKYYYKGITSCFEFEYWGLLYNAIVSHNASNYVSSVSAFIRDHKAVRPDAETSLFMTNHDHSSKTGNGQARAADDLGRDLQKEKQAAAMILTTPGKPFIYQGEELGYWGNADGKGDEYIRAPIVWDAAAKDCAKKGVNNKVDATMLKGDISVETQTADENSLLNTYKTWSRLRNSYDAIASGDMTATSISAGSAVASWYMTAGSQKLLVIHNCSTSAKTMTVEDSMAKPVAVLGVVTASGKELTLGAYSSVVFEL